MSWLNDAEVETSVEREFRLFNSKKQQIESQVQARLDDFARTRNYDSSLTCASYATSTNTKFAAEGQYMVQARDATWTACYTMLEEVEQGVRPVPDSIDDIVSELPSLSWPN